MHACNRTCPSEARLLLMDTPSSRPTPSRPVSFGRSEPARSTKLSLERNALRQIPIGAPAEVRVRVRGGVGGVGGGDELSASLERAEAPSVSAVAWHGVA